MLNTLILANNSTNPYSNKLRLDRKRMKDNINILIKEKDVVKNKTHIDKLLEKNEGMILKSKV